MSMSGGDLVNAIAELRHQYPEESDKDWARRIYRLVYNELKKWVLTDTTPLWLVWDRKTGQEGVDTNQLRAICATNELALKCKAILIKRVKSRSGTVHIEQTRLNHLFAWTIIQKVLKEEKI